MTVREVITLLLTNNNSLESEATVRVLERDDQGLLVVNVHTVPVYRVHSTGSIVVEKHRMKKVVE